MRCRSVDLPAPLGPSSPVTPGPRANDTSLSATTLPYQRETWSTASAAGVAAAATGPSTGGTGSRLGATGGVGTVTFGSLGSAGW